MTVTNNELINRALGMARSLSYNDEKDGPIKHTLQEMAHRLGRLTVKVVRDKHGRMCVLDCYGGERVMTFTECVLYRLFGIIPPMRPWRERKE